MFRIPFSYDTLYHHEELLRKYDNVNKPGAQLKGFSLIKLTSLTCLIQLNPTVNT